MTVTRYISSWMNAEGFMTKILGIDLQCITWLTLEKTLWQIWADGTKMQHQSLATWWIHHHRHAGVCEVQPPKKKYSLINKYISECMGVVWWFKISAPQESYFLIYFTRKYSLLRFKISFTSESWQHKKFHIKATDKNKI